MKRKIDSICVCDDKLAYDIAKALEQLGEGYETEIDDTDENRTIIKVVKHIF
jgi:hypothetical protein